MRRKSDPPSPARREELEKKLEAARTNPDAFDLDYDEVTDVIDIITEQTKRSTERCQKVARNAIDSLREIGSYPLRPIKEA